MQWSSLVISVAALLASLASVWRTHFTPPRLRVITGAASLKIDRIDSGSEYWYLPQITVPISVSNIGARVAHILEARLIVRYPQNDAEEAYEVFHLLYEIDPVRSAALKPSQARKIRNLYNGPGTPFIVGARETVTKHLVFQTRWDYEVEEADFAADLQLRTSSADNWITYQQFDGWALDGWLWRSINNSTFQLGRHGWENSIDQRHPSSLHRIASTGATSAFSQEGSGQTESGV
jgi:hypothetical protein